MIKMDRKELILHYYRVDGLSLREISRRVGLNRKTVTPYVRDFEKMSLQDGEDGIERCLQQKPAYSSCRKSERTRLTDAVCAEIDYLSGKAGAPSSMVILERERHI